MCGVIESDPLRALYGWVNPGEPLEVLAGRGRLGTEEVGNVVVSFPMRRDMHARWRASEAGWFDRGDQTLRMSHPHLGEVTINVMVADSAGRGFVELTDLGEGDQFTRVIAHWINLPLIHPSDRLASNDGWWSGRWTADAGDWRLTLDSRPDLADTIRQMDEHDEQFAMTHVGELRRTDGHPFDRKLAWHVLYGWQLAMSFALGRWVAPAVPVGLDEDNKPVGEQWAPWRCDEMRGYESWWDNHTGDDLAAFVSDFLISYLDPVEHPVLRHLAHHTIAANHSGTTGEAKIMLASAGLEYLGWVNLKLSGRKSGKEYKALSARDVLSLLLGDASIPTAVPAELNALSTLSSRERFDGPSAVAWVRNRLVHPKDPSEPYRIADLVWQTSQLLLEYAELLVLHRVGYAGRFRRRYPPSRWAHTTESVPWIP